MVPSGKKKRKIIPHMFIEEKTIPEVTCELEISVLEGLLRRCELEEDYETAAATYDRIQELREETTM